MRYTVPRPRHRAFVRLCVIVAAVFAPLVTHGESVPARARMETAHKEFLGTHCMRCHNADDANGGARFDDIPLEIADVATAERWQKVLNALNSGSMPPEDEPQPANDAKEMFLGALSGQMVLARKALGDTGGEITMRRLNRREYVNTIRDLLGVDVDARDLPADSDPGRFDTIGAGLFFSSDQFEHYLRIGRIALDEAIVQGDKPAVQRVRIEPEVETNKQKRETLDQQIETLNKYRAWKKSGRPSQEFGWQDDWDATPGPTIANLGLPALRAYLTDPATKTGVLLREIFLGEAKTHVPNNAPPGRYVLRMQIGVAEPRPDGRPRFLEYGLLGEVAGSSEMKILGCRRVDGTVENPQVMELPLTIRRVGSRTIAVRDRRHNTGDAGAYSFTYGHERTLCLDWIEWEGPIIEQWPPEAHARIFAGIDLAANSGEAEARSVIERFATRAFRGRSVRPGFVDRLVSHYAERREAGEPFLEAIKTPLAMVLASPNFLYISERPTVAASAEARPTRPPPLSDVELANRLSYFLWAGPPDERLLTLAAEKKLSDPPVLAAQVDRMLADARSDRFVDGFVHQWLHMIRLDFFQFHFSKFPEFDSSVKEATRREVYTTFRDVLDNGRPLGTLLKSDAIMVNDLLADYYGIGGVDGVEFRRVTVPAGLPRGGLLGMAAIHVMGSDGERTSPVERGAWVLRKLLNDPPPPAPPNVPMLSRFNDRILPARELMTAHQEQPQCAVCHRKIDPIGYGLEHFDAAGRWRDQELAELKKDNQVIKKESFPIDTRGALPDGTPFDGFEQLRDAVATHEPDFARGFAEHLVEYALGRSVSFADEELLAALLHETESRHFTPRAVIHALVASKTFHSK